MSVQYQNIPERPPEYNSLSNPDPPNVPLIMIPVRKEIRQVAERQKRNQVVKRYACVLFSVFLLFVLGFLVAHFLWVHLWKHDTESRNIQRHCKRRLVGYYSDWDDRNITGKQIEKLTHLVFIGVRMKADGKIEFESDERRVLFFNMKTKVRNMKSNVQVLFSTDYYSYNRELVSLIMKESKTRKVWIDSISSFILEQQLDGVEIYYRWPITKEEKENFVFFVRELRYKLERMEKLTRRHSPYIITMVTDSSLDSETFIHDLMKSVDFFSVETDNFYSPTHPSEIVGPLSPLFSANDGESIDDAMKKLICKSREPSRFDITLPFRGSYFEKVKHPMNTSDELYRSVDLVDGQSQGALIAWSDLKNREFDFNKAIWHDESKTSYIWDEENQKLYTFDDARSLKEKVKYAVSRNLGGIAVRELEMDDNANTLLNAVTSIDTCLDSEKDDVKYDCENFN
uniref:Glyco_18 domain-containing protein n=1 Tax=Caenorhabditis tropicalis TaxID=1561998 RepID=A0A1I7U9Q0_9PELO